MCAVCSVLTSGLGLGLGLPVHDFTENLAAGTGDAYDIAAAVKSWTDEACEYNIRGRAGAADWARLEARCADRLLGVGDGGQQRSTTLRARSRRTSRRSSGRAPRRSAVPSRSARASSPHNTA